MKLSNYSKNATRREFLSRSAAVSLGAMGFVNTLTNMNLMSSAAAQDEGDGDGYKALICIFLQGGLDSNNLFFPLDGTLGDRYARDRASMRITADRAQQVQVKNMEGVWGGNNAMPNLADLFKNEKAAVIGRVGTLSFPVANRFEAGRTQLPRQLYAHNSQQLAWQTSVADTKIGAGVGGRLAELVNDRFNQSSGTSMTYTTAGSNFYLRGATGAISPYAVDSRAGTVLGGSTALQGYGTNYSRARSRGAFLTNEYGRRLRRLDTTMRLGNRHFLEAHHQKTIVDVIDSEQAIREALTNGSASRIVDQNFSGLDDSFGRQLKSVAKLIASRDQLRQGRQVFFVSRSGFDTHRSQVRGLDSILAELDNAINALQTTLGALNIEDKVTTFTASDFSRTYLPNVSGTDHAWAGNMVVIGGGVDGGKLYGKYPSLEANGDDTYGEGFGGRAGGRGLWISHVSVEQHYAVLANWFGVEAGELEAILPNLNRFDNPMSSDAPNLKYMKGMI